MPRRIAGKKLPLGIRQRHCVHIHSRLAKSYQLITIYGFHLSIPCPKELFRDLGLKAMALKRALCSRHVCLGALLIGIALNSFSVQFIAIESNEINERKQ